MLRKLICKGRTALVPIDFKILKRRVREAPEKSLGAAPTRIRFEGFK